MQIMITASTSAADNENRTTGANISKDNPKRRIDVYSNVGKRKRSHHLAKQETISTFRQLKSHYTTMNGILYEEVSNTRAVVFWYDPDEDRYVTYNGSVNKKDKQVTY